MLDCNKAKQNLMRRKDKVFLIMEKEWAPSFQVYPKELDHTVQDRRVRHKWTERADSFSPPSLSFSVALSAGASFFRSGSSLDPSPLSRPLYLTIWEFCIQFLIEELILKRISWQIRSSISFGNTFLGWLRSTLRRSTFKSERLNREIRFPAVPSPSIWSFFLPYKPCSYE